MGHSANSKNRRGADWELEAQPVVESSDLKAQGKEDRKHASQSLMCVCVSPRDLVKKQILIQVRSEAWDSAFLIRSPVMLMPWVTGSL